MDASDLPVPDSRPAPPAANLFDALPEGVLRFDAALRVVYANAAFERATATSRHAYIGRRLEEVEAFAPYAALWRDALAEVLDTEQESWFKFRFDHPLGPRHFEVRLLLERTAPAHVTALLRDVSFSRGAMRALRGAGALAETLLGSVNVGVALLDRQLRYRHWNGFLERLTGIDAAQVIGRRPDETIDLAADAEGLASYERLRAGGRATDSCDVALPVAARPLVHVRRTPIFDARGHFDGVFITVERIEADRFAQTSLSALRGALEQAGEMVLQVGADGRLIDANAAALNALGLTRDDLGRLSLRDIDAELTAEEMAAMVERLRRRGADRRETRYRTRSGGQLAVDVIAQCALQAQQETIFLLARDIGGRRRFELALVESAERFRSLFDESPVALLLLDAHLRVVQANGAASRLLDQALIDLIGQDAAALLHPADVAAAQALRRDLAAEALGANADVRLTRADGRSAWAHLVVRGWRGAERARQYLLVLEDHTERKQAALQLEAAVGQQRTLLETMTAAVAQVRDGHVLHANGEFARLFGFDQAAIEGLPLAKLAQPPGEGEPGVLPPVEPGRAGSIETRLYRADGEPLWCLVQARAIEPVGAHRSAEAIYTFQDVSASREARETLTRSLLELNLVFDSTEVALLHLADGRVIRCNAQAVTMFGGADGPLGRAFAALVEWSPDQPVPACLDLRRALSGAQHSEVRMRGADGKPFWALVSMRAIDAQHPAAGQIVTVLNIDARKRAEDEVRQMREYLDLVIEHLPVMVAVRDARDGRFIGVNRAGEQLAGRPRGQMIGRTWRQLYPRQFADELESLDARAIADGQMIDQPRVTSESADGRPLIVHRRVLPVFDQTDAAAPRRPRYVMSIVDDLTAEVHTEAALHDTEAHIRELAEHIDAFLFIADRSLAELSYVSPRCEAVLGIPAAQLLADPRLALERVQAAQRPALARRLPLVLARLARLRKTELTVRIDHPSRGARSITVRFTPVRTPDGGLRIFGIAEDASQREESADLRVAEALKQRDALLREAHARIKNNLHGVAGLLQQQAFARPELTEPLSGAAAQIEALAQVHDMQTGAGGDLALAGLVRGIFARLGGAYGARVQLEPPPASLAAWGLPGHEAVPLALVINELAGNAVKHRSKSEQRVVGRLIERGTAIELRIEQPGKLPEDFDLVRIDSGVSGLGLIKALLPRRGARLHIEQLGPLVITRLELMAPVVRRDATSEPQPAGP